MRSSEIRAQIRYHEQLLEESRAAERQAQDKVESLAAYNREHAVVTRRMEADLSARRGRLTTADIDVTRIRSAARFIEGMTAFLDQGYAQLSQRCDQAVIIAEHIRQAEGHWENQRRDSASHVETLSWLRRRLREAEMMEASSE